MLKELITIPLGGLCNRIRTIASARRICQLHGAQCTILWDWPDYQNFFEHRDDTVFRRNLSIKARLSHYYIEHLRPHQGGSPRNWHIPTSTHERIVVKSRYVFNAAEESRIISSAQLKPWLLQPSLLVAEKVKTFSSSHFQTTVGMHIRRTDHKPATEATPDSVCISYAKGVIDQNKTIFLATDNFATEKLMKSMFKTNIIIYQKNPLLNERWPRKSNLADDVVDDLVDLYLLASSEYVLGSALSSFSNIAMVYNGSPLCCYMADSKQISEACNGIDPAALAGNDDQVPRKGSSVSR